MTTALEALLSPQFDRIFSRFATASWAENAERLDAPSVHAEMRRGIGKVINAARQGADPGQRIVLVQGDAGLGKTHVLTAELRRHAKAGTALPVVMQLAVDIDPGTLSLWLVKKIFDELGSGSFRDGEGRTPLEHLAAKLWQSAPHSDKDRFMNALERDDDAVADGVAASAAHKIVRKLAEKGLNSDHIPIVAGILLRAEDRGYAFKAWINHATGVQKVGDIKLEPLTREDQRKAVIVQLACVCLASDFALVLTFDQIEATAEIGSDVLLKKLLTYVIQLVDDDVVGTAIIISALNDTIERVSGGISGGLLERLNLQPEPILLGNVGREALQDILYRRARALAEEKGLPASRANLDALAPAWLIPTDARQPRIALEVVRGYREKCEAAGKLLTEGEFRRSPQPTAQSLDFDKLWADKKDQLVGGVRNFSDQGRVQLLEWFLQKAAPEIAGLKKTLVVQGDLSGAHPTRYLGVTFVAADETPFESWKIGYADATVAGGRLRDQINAFVRACTDAKPAIVSPRKLTGFNGSVPDRTENALGRLAAGQAFLNVLRIGGRICSTESRDWESLASAKDFFSEYGAAPGFERWRIERRFLTNEIEAGGLRLIATPEGDPSRLGLDPIAPDRGPQPRVASSTSERGSDSIVPPPQQDASIGSEDNVAPPEAGDPRDRARILIGAEHGGRTLVWNLDRTAAPSLPNFGLSVTGDAGQGKTQAIKAIIADVAKLDCPILIFDFKNDYGDDFAEKHRFTVVDLRSGMPFNPLKPPPQGPSGAQIITHVYEIASMLASTLGLGAQQEAMLREGVKACFEANGEPLDEWRHPEDIRAPSFSEVVAHIETTNGNTATGLVNRLGLLHGLRLLPADAQARLSFDELMRGRFVLSFNQLPNDDGLKGALAELILIQLQGYMLRGEQPRALRRLLVFDEAWRAAGSPRLIQLAREGRAFGVGVIVGTQFPDDLSSDLVGNLASKLYLYNSDATKRLATVRALIGSTTGQAAFVLRDVLAALAPFEAVFSNQQAAPYRKIRITPYFERPF